MPHRVSKVLIVSNPYDAFVMQEDGGLMEHVFTSYRDVSLTSIPRFTVVSTAKTALYSLAIEKFDLVIIVLPKLIGLDAISLGEKIKKQCPDLPVVLLAHGIRSLPKSTQDIPKSCIDNVFLWSGNREIMWTILKWTEDRLNVTHDTAIARVRVIILIEDSPYYYSSLLPILHQAVVQQTAALIGDTANEEHRLWMLRARPKILLAQSYEEGMDLYTRFKPYLLGILSDTKYPRKGEVDPEAGVVFLQKVKAELPELPMLLLSSEKSNSEAAQRINTSFQDKNSPSLHLEIKKFLVTHLGFGDFVFRMPDGREVGRASNLYALEKALKDLPSESLMYHLFLNHISNWLMARSEIFLAAKFRAAKSLNLKGIEQIRSYLINTLHQKRMLQQRGLIVPFNPQAYDSDFEMLRIGEGSLGGKARGLAFMARYLQENMEKLQKFKNIKVTIPRALIIATDCYDKFLEENGLMDYSQIKCTDAETASLFAAARLPDVMMKDLRLFLEKNTTPLAVRSSSLLEDSRDQPYAGLYATYMVPNNHPDIAVRLTQLAAAIKATYASVFYESPKAFAKTTQHRTEEEKMAVLIQPITGHLHGDYFYPSMAGTAQSYNYYPISQMRPEEGIAHISLGLGKIVVEGGQTLKFSPAYPTSLYQFSTVEDMLDNSQKYFYALKMDEPDKITLDHSGNLVKRSIFDATDEEPVKLLSSSYSPFDHRIRDTFSKSGSPVLTFASILKYEYIPLAPLLRELLNLGRKGFGCDVEIEFAVNISPTPEQPSEFVLLQARPMSTPEEQIDMEFSTAEQHNAICFSTNTLGYGVSDPIHDIIYVKEETITSRNTVSIARQISQINAALAAENRKYFLIGPGRWGSSDHCLGIPVGWSDISEVAGIIELASELFKVDPSQGTHFFQNITSLGIPYFSIYKGTGHIKWDWFKAQPVTQESENICHVRLHHAIFAKVNGHKAMGLISP
jgi:hypothetical protein